MAQNWTNVADLNQYEVPAAAPLPPGDYTPASQGQPLQPSVSFLAGVFPPATNNATEQVLQIEADLAGNITAYFAPTAVDIASRVVQGPGTRRMLLAAAGPEQPSSRAGKGGAEDHTRLQDSSKPRLASTRDASTVNHESSRLISCSNAGRGDMPGCHSSRARSRSLLQASKVTLAVNVTFPPTTQVPTSQETASAFSQALQDNSSQVLGGFYQGWGTAGVGNVSLTVVDLSADAGPGSQARPPPPPAPATAAAPDPGNGSVGSFIGIAVAAVLGCSALAGMSVSEHRSGSLRYGFEVTSNMRRSKQSCKHVS